MVLIRYHRDEFPAARAAIEATPVRRRRPFRAAYTGVAADVLPWLREQDAPPPPAEQIRHAIRMALAPLAAQLDQPAPHTDWSGRLATIDGIAYSATTQLADNTTRTLDHLFNGYVFGVHQLTAPLLAELVELTHMQLVTSRQAVRVHAEAELALYAAELAPVEAMLKGSVS